MDFLEDLGGCAIWIIIGVVILVIIACVALVALGVVLD